MRFDNLLLYLHYNLLLLFHFFYQMSKRIPTLGSGTNLFKNAIDFRVPDPNVLKL